MADKAASLVSRRNRQVVYDAIVAALDGDGSTEFMPDVTPDQAATWIIDGPLSDPVIVARLVHADASVEDVQRWMENGPKWDRILTRSIELTIEDDPTGTDNTEGPVS